MKTSQKRLEILLYVVISLLITNIVISIIHPDKTDKDSGENIEKVLPDFISISEIKSLMDNVQEYYNAGNAGKLYDMLGPYAKIMIDYEEFEISMNQLDFFGKIQRFVYTHSEYAGKQDGYDFFILMYKTSFVKGKGTSQITIICRDNEYEVVGIRFHIPNLGK